MRLFYVREGSKFEGEYPIYEGKEEFERYNPGVPYYRWAREENPLECIKIGNWIEAEDGYIVQILNFRVMGQGSIFIKVPMGTFPIWKLVKGTWKWSKLYAQFTNGDMYKANGKRGTAKNTTITRFVSLVIAGVHPLKAYDIATGKPSVHSRAKILHILKTKEFKMEMQNQLVPFKEKLSSKFSEDMLIKELESLIKNSRPGTQSHRENIEFIMRLSGIIEPDSKKAIRAKEIEYQEVPPPQLP